MTPGFASPLTRWAARASGLGCNAAKHAQQSDHTLETYVYPTIGDTRVRQGGMAQFRLRALRDWPQCCDA